MKAIEFPEQNLILAKDQPQYTPLPVFVNSAQREVPMTHKWEFTDEELAELCKTKHLYITQLTFGQNLQPIKLDVKNPFMKIVVLMSEHLNESTLKEIQPGWKIYNRAISEDRPLYEVGPTDDKKIWLSELFLHTGETKEQHVKTWGEFASMLRLHMNNDQWFIVYQ